ncbi:potassium channel family protein [Natronolimnohabitans innermongolicus]|uniref:TrkA-N domain-containing protein n=1 Tax=Natronolimnohabitans innermongolicus JCM 12255 TaxID=1227499 RepID=L9WIP1_9EURY|nr:TrkA family potassium uptake protein [Natronolimnohabitans innermongolicus]ELY49319.1 TrkA-N domain-containing protein [Natronolimnohabitans innermongolicus JCM 12255]
MKFVIVGYGRVGSRTARIMAEEGHDVVVVDDDSERTDRAERDGFETVRGGGDDEAVLVDAGIDTADAIGAFTPDLNVNFAACMVGKHHDCRTVLRIDEDYREDIYERYAEDVDDIIYPERLGAAGAKTAMLGGDFNVVADLATNLQLTVLEIGDDSPAVGKRMSELDLPGDARIYAHGRRRESLTLPLPGTELEAGDEVAVIAETDRADDVRETLSPASA